MKMRCMWAILSVAVLMCIYSHICPASETHPPSPPDPAAIFEQARIAESGVVFSENFDGNNPSSLEQIYWGRYAQQGHLFRPDEGTGLIRRPFVQSFCYVRACGR